MSREIPEPVRAAAGLAATVLDEVRKLPETLPGLPVRAIGLAMQAALKLQQEYAGLVARGDELFTGIRGENEPGLATFDDDEGSAPPPSPAGFRDSAFDRADPPPLDAIGDTEQAERALEELAIENALLESEADAASGGAAPATLVDVADGERGAGDVEAVVTEEAVVVPEPEATSTEELATEEPATQEPATEETATATDEGGTPIAAAEPIDTGTTDTGTTDTGTTDTGTTDTGTTDTDTSAPAREPVDGYDGFTIAQLRGRLRGYAPSTVEALLAYEEANRAREPYLRMLRNRLQRVTADAVAASPLAPRGA